MNQSTGLLLAPSMPADRSSEFVPVTGGGETASAPALLIAAYILMWACVFGLVWLSIKRLSRISERLTELERQLDAKDADPA